MDRTQLPFAAPDADAGADRDSEPLAEPGVETVPCPEPDPAVDGGRAAPEFDAELLPALVPNTEPGPEPVCPVDSHPAMASTTAVPTVEIAHRRTVGYMAPTMPPSQDS